MWFDERTPIESFDENKKKMRKDDDTDTVQSIGYSSGIACRSVAKKKNN